MGEVRTKNQCAIIYNIAEALRANALAENAFRLCSLHAVRRRSSHVQAPLGLLMPGRSHASTTANARCGSLRRANLAPEHQV